MPEEKRVTGYRRCAVIVIDRATDTVVATTYSSLPKVTDHLHLGHLQICIGEAGATSEWEAQGKLETQLARKNILGWFRRVRPLDGEYSDPASYVLLRTAKDRK